MNRVLICKIVFFFILCSSCSTTETKIYSLYLNDLKEYKNTQKVDAVAFIHIKAHKYLEQPYIVFKTSPYELTPSSYAKWDTYPSEIIKEQILEYLSKRGPFKEVKTTRPVITGNSYLISINLKDLSRYDTGSLSYGILALSVSLKDSAGKEIYHKEFNQREPLQDRSYLSLAKGISAALNVVLIEMTEGINSAMRGQAAK